MRVCDRCHSGFPDTEYCPACAELLNKAMNEKCKPTGPDSYTRIREDLQKIVERCNAMEPTSGYGKVDLLVAISLIEMAIKKF